MRDRLLRVCAIALLLSSLFNINVFAGQWHLDGKGWWYRNSDGSYPVNTWLKIDGDWYLFDKEGYIYIKTFTPDGYYVDINGRYIEHSFRYKYSNNTYEYESISIDLQEPIDSVFFNVTEVIDDNLTWRGKENHMEKLPDGNVLIRFINDSPSISDTQYLDIVVSPTGSGNRIRVVGEGHHNVNYDRAAH